MYNDHLEQFTLTLADILKSVKKIKERRMSDFGLRSTHVMVVYLLGRYPDGLTPADLCEAGDIDKSQVSRVLSELTEKGYVAPVSSGMRRYKSRLCLTEAGKELAHFIALSAAEVQTEVSGNIPPEDLAAFYRTLFALQTNFQALVEEENAE